VSKTIPLAAVLGLGLLALAPAARGAAAPVLKPWLPEAERLVARLGDPDFRAREDAERRLFAMGVKVVPLLRTALGHRSPDVRRRARRLIPALESAALLSPKRVTLRVVKQPVRVVVEEMSKQTGYKINLWGGVVGKGEPVYSFDFRDVPFWEAVDRVCQEAGLMVQQSWGDDQVRLMRQGAANRLIGREGAFRYAAQNFQLSRYVDLSMAGAGAGGAPARSENLNFSFLLFAEPKLPFLSMEEVQVNAAYDNEKNSMLLPRDPGPVVGPGGVLIGRWGGPRFYGTNRQLCLHVSVGLQRPSKKATTMKLLRGSVPVTLLLEQKPLVVTDKVMSAKGKKFKVEKIQFSFEEVTKQANGQVQLKMTITNEDKNNAGDFNWTNSLYQRIELQDDKGNKFQTWGTNWHGNGPNHVQLTLTYSSAGLGPGKVGPPSKFVYQSWRTRQHHIAFEFKDVPLP
jgi:hypothetical protein